ncbi:MAG TPA: hypothetical protein VFQ53_21775 [Kofleriaceae bacterium]|nr:hypothetical protein [Kofleriaceae bacterium]
MADHTTPSATFSAEASWSLGYGDRPVVRDHREPVVVQPAPIYTQPARPIYSEPFYSPNNTRVTASGSTYIGAFFQRPMTVARRPWFRAEPLGWFNLTEATRIDNEREFFNLRERSGGFHKLALKAVAGRTDIRQVAIEYRVNGRIETQKVQIHSHLDQHIPQLTINLAGDSRDIQRIVVYGDSGRGAAYQLMAL